MFPKFAALFPKEFFNIYSGVIFTPLFLQITPITDRFTFFFKYARMKHIVPGGEAMGKENTAYFWKKKELTSYLLSIFIFLIHISSFEQHTYSGTAISHINGTVSYFFGNALTRFAVPMFFLLSGVAFFRDYTNRSYGRKLKSRLFTLVIPYLIWNTVWMVFNTICSYSFLSDYFIGREKFVLTPVNVLKGIFLYECNGPFWSIFNLIAFTLLAPVFDFLAAEKKRAFLSVGILCLLPVFVEDLPFLFHTNSVTYYLIGAIIGKHYLSRFTGKAGRKTQILSLLFLCLYFVLKTIFRPAVYAAERHPVAIPFFTFCAFCLWNSMDLFVDQIKERPLYSRSFAVYAMHENVSAVLTKLFALAVRKAEIHAIPNFIFTVLSTLFFINLFCHLTARHCPKLYGLLLGRRGR